MIFFAGRVVGGGGEGREKRRKSRLDFQSRISTKPLGAIFVENREDDEEFERS